MDRIGSYDSYVKSYNAVKEESSVRREAADRAQSAAETKEGEKKIALSNDAKELLKELQKKYGNMDFIVADYENEDEAAAYLSRGMKEYSVLIEPETLEKMAADKEVKSQYIGMIEDATSQLSNMKTKLGEAGKEVTHLGISIGDDGAVTFFADLEKLSEKQRERIENAREEKKEAAAKNDRTSGEKSRRTRVSAGSVEELLEKIRNVDWNKIKAESAVSGSRIDYTA